MESITKKAYAKINIGLDVTGRRPNGYHDVSMIMQSIDIFDEISIVRTEGNEISLHINSIAPGVLPDGEELSVGANNLCTKAASRLMDDAGVSAGLDITLTKNIPIAAGLGGGSADAAAVLLGANELLDLGYTKDALAVIAVAIGADVPFCLYGGTMLAEGIGEQLTPLNPLPGISLVLARPNIPVSTGSVYRDLDACEDPIHPDIPALLKAVASSDVSGVCDHAGNILEDVTIPAHPVIKDFKKHMIAEGARSACMSGSGPSVFGFFHGEAEAAACAESLRTAYPDCYAISTQTI